MAIAVAVERLSDHPLAEAIARDGEQFLDEQPISAAMDLASLTGRGVKARVNGETVLNGKAEMFGRDGFATLLDETASTSKSLRITQRKSAVLGKRVALRVDLGGGRFSHEKKPI